MNDNDGRIRISVQVADQWIGCIGVILLIIIANYLGHIADALRQLVAKM